MQIDTPQSYGTISRLLHWLMAAAFLFMLLTAVAWNINEDYFSLMDWHKSIGLLLGILAAVRLIWALANVRRRPQNTLIAKAGHLALYGLMLAVPLVGMVRQYGSGRDFSWFGVLPLPRAAERIEWMTALGNQWHGTLAWVFFGLVAGHVLAAILHQIKGEKILNRMAGRRD